MTSTPTQSLTVAMSEAEAPAPQRLAISRFVRRPDLAPWRRRFSSSCSSPSHARRRLRFFRRNAGWLNTAAELGIIAIPVGILDGRANSTFPSGSVRSARLDYGGDRNDDLRAADC